MRVVMSRLCGKAGRADGETWGVNGEDIHFWYVTRMDTLSGEIERQECRCTYLAVWRARRAFSAS